MSFTHTRFDPSKALTHSERTLADRVNEISEALATGGGGSAGVADEQTISGTGSVESPYVIIQNTRDRIDVKNTYSADVTGTNDATTAVRNAITAAAANVTSTGRRTTLYFEPGEYSFRTKDATRILDLAAKNGLVFQGE